MDCVVQLPLNKDGSGDVVVMRRFKKMVDASQRLLFKRKHGHSVDGNLDGRPSTTVCMSYDVGRM